ncbi:ABC transporter permease [Cytobacillus sp. FJAT-54145]|uniref:ABC transporter permease n=1 Tax=Cytobacillus spartinae TaxID=3299023 RepID=A0ABW6K805_9BACI
MLFQIIKKDLLMFWRRPRELIILLLMPFVLISILGTALGAINNGDVPELNIKVAIVGDDEVLEGELKEVENLGLSSDIKSIIENRNPIKILIEDVLGSEELKESVDVDIYHHDLTHEEELKYTGVIEIPADFNTKYYSSLLLQEGSTPQINLYLNESTSFEGEILKEIITSFQEELSWWTTLGALGMNIEEIENKASSNLGEVKTVSERKTIDSVTYYAIGMSVMFIFYVASTASTFAYEQKHNYTFGRLLIANVPGSVFFTGIFTSTVLVAFIQMSILFGLSALIHDVRWPSVIDFIVITLLLSMMIGSFAVLLSALSYRINSDSVSSQFSNFLIPILAFMGGSYFPISRLGSFFEVLSTYSPAGAGISAYFKIMQGYSLSDVTGQIMVLVVVSVLLLIVATKIQPKRGEMI